jgi:mRNA interferase RelE/StbE
MKVEFRESFAKDLRSVRDRTLFTRVKQVIESAEQARNLDEISNIRKLRSTEQYYRIRIGDYRIGLSADNDTLTFIRFLHRKDIYRYFP